MGKRFGEVTNEIKNVAYDVENGPNGTPRVRIGDRQYTPQELSALILQKMKQTAEDYLGQTVTEAVITVPAYFNDAERQGHQRSGSDCRSRRENALSTSQPQPRWPTVSIKPTTTRKLPSSTLVAVRSISRFWNWAMVYLK